MICVYIYGIYGVYVYMGYSLLAKGSTCGASCKAAVKSRHELFGPSFLQCYVVSLRFNYVAAADENPWLQELDLEDGKS